MEEKIQTEQEQSLVKSFNQVTLKSAFTPKVILIFVLVVIGGLLSGYFIANKTGGNVAVTTTSPISGSSVAKGSIVGSNDTTTFKDTTEGVLKEGGINGEGAFHLERPGGDSQNVYLTSSSVDLSKFIGKKIKVWGQTQKAQYAGWLMDVGRIQVE